MAETFINKPLNETLDRITVEPFVGGFILCVEGRRVGHALDQPRVEPMKHYLATALEDLEKLFTGKSGASQKNAA